MKVDDGSGRLTLLVSWLCLVVDSRDILVLKSILVLVFIQFRKVFFFCFFLSATAVLAGTAESAC